MYTRKWGSRAILESAAGPNYLGLKFTSYVVRQATSFGLSFLFCNMKTVTVVSNS